MLLRFKNKFCTYVDNISCFDSTPITTLMKGHTNVSWTEHARLIFSVNIH